MIQSPTPEDVPALKSIIDATGLFPPDLLDPMIAPFFSAGGEDIWLASRGESGLDGLLYCAPEPMTSGTWNMLLIAVHPTAQKAGKGSGLVCALEAALAARGGRVLLVETSALPEFETTRRFYRGRGYVEEARIRDFYETGEDKIVFWKALDGQLSQPLTSSLTGAQSMNGLQTLDPAKFPAVFKSNFDARLIDTLVGGYAEDAVLDLGGDNVFRGHDQIRAAITNFLAPQLPISVTSRRALQTGDHAVVLFDWVIEGKAPDGSPVHMAGAAVDVLRRDGGGVWRQILDLPFGHATP